MKGARPVYVAGAAAVSACGFEWRGIGPAVVARSVPLAPSVQLAASHGCVQAAEVPAIPGSVDVEARALKLMSHPARLAAVALRLAIADAGWPQAALQHAALYMGVGASGGSMAELTAMLDASIDHGQFTVERFGRAGLAACNPLFAFQLMNNFTLCHGAIQAGTGGPNGAFYSRGTGTVAALEEARWLLASGDCEHALAGGADSLLHPVTWEAWLRDGHDAGGRMPGEGAAWLALSCASQGALARLDHAAFHGAPAWRAEPGLVERMLAAHPPGEGDLVVTATSHAALREHFAQALPAGLQPIDCSAALGESLAASPVLAWVVALDLLRQGRARRALVLSAGLDGGVGLVVLEAVR